MWKSAIPGTYCTSRDFLQELIDAADKKGIKILIYITSAASWAIEHYNKFDGVEWVNPDAYKLYKNNPDIDIAIEEHFKRYYVPDILKELVTNYPKIAGFWYDGWYCRDFEEEVFEYVHSIKPEALNIKNNYSNAYAKGEDVMSLEDWKGADNFARAPQSHYGVTYHYNLPNSTSIPPFNREATFKTIGGWKYGDYRPELSDHPDDIKRIITIVSNSWVAVPGYGPLIGGDFPEPLEKFNRRLIEFMIWAKESIKDALGGGHGLGGFAPGYWNDGFSGVTTFVPTNNTHYIHVLEAPAEKGQLVISDCGYNVLSVSDLQTAKPVHFTQKGGLLYIDFRQTHESDTILKIITDGTERVITSVDCLITSGNDHENRIINFEDTSDFELPCEIVINWHRSRIVCGLKILQAETTAIPDSIRIRDFELYAADNSHGRIFIKSGSLNNQRGMQVITFDSIATKTLMLRLINNYNNTYKCKVMDIEPIGL